MEKDEGKGMQRSAIYEKLRKKKIKCSYGDLPPHQRVISQILENGRRPLTTNEVAGYGNMSWITAKKHLEILEKKNIGIIHKKIGNRTEWFLK